jgi:hypothetical protein
VSELLDRIRREIRERLEASRAAVVEHERLEAALHALSNAGSRATRAVTDRGYSSRSSAPPPRSSGSVKPSKRARSSKPPAALYVNREITGAMVGRQPFGGGRLSGTGPKAGGPDYLLSFVEARAVTENTMRHGLVV